MFINPKYDYNEYKNIINSEDLKSEISNKLSNKIQYNEIMNMISFNIVENTNNIIIRYKNTDREKTVLAADEFTKMLVEYINNSSKEKLNQSLLVLNQLEKNELDEIDLQNNLIKDLLGDYDTIDDISKEISNLSYKISNYENLLYNNEILIEQTNSALETLRSELALEEEYIYEEKSLLEDDFLRQLLSRDYDVSLKDLNDIVTSKKIKNPKYEKLTDLIFDYNLSKVKADIYSNSLKNELVSLNEKLSENKSLYNLVKADYLIIKNIIDEKKINLQIIQDKKNQAELIANLIETNQPVEILSSINTSSESIIMKKVLLIVGFVTMGLINSIVGDYLVNYWNDKK